MKKAFTLLSAVAAALTFAISGCGGDKDASSAANEPITLKLGHIQSEQDLWQLGSLKFKEELEAVHTRFKEQVLRYRPHLDADKVTTGEHWLAVDAKELGLVDEIATSDEYIKERMGLTIDSALKIKWKKQEKKNLISKFLPKSALSKAIFGKGIDPVESAQKLEEHDNTYMNMR